MWQRSDANINSYLSVQFVSPVAVEGESFETDDQHSREGPQVKLFRRLLFFFAVGTSPEMKNMLKLNITF